MVVLERNSSLRSVLGRWLNSCFVVSCHSSIKKWFFSSFSCQTSVRIHYKFRTSMKIQSNFELWWRPNRISNSNEEINKYQIPICLSLDVEIRGVIKFRHPRVKNTSDIEIQMILHHISKYDFSSKSDFSIFGFQNWIKGK